MTADEALASLTNEQLDALYSDPEFRGPGRQRLKQEKERRASAEQS